MKRQFKFTRKKQFCLKRKNYTYGANGSIRYKSIQHYINDFTGHNEFYYRLLKNYNKICQDHPITDKDWILRAIVAKDIESIRHSKFCYKNPGERAIHEILLNIQNEFMLYDMRCSAVFAWFQIRVTNTLNKINHTRQRFNFFERLNFSLYDEQSK